MNNQDTTISISHRNKEIIDSYREELNKHIQDLREGKVERTFGVADFAELLHIHPTHLSNVLHQVSGKSPCDMYENSLVELSKELLAQTNKSIGDIARQLDYDPSNFTKFFKNYTGLTPKQYRQGLHQA